MSPEYDAALPPLALIAGPTASGKSDLAVRLALALEERGKRAVVINADSAQVYSDLRVLSARPDEDEMQGIEHRLFGAWDGATTCSAADWAVAAKAEVVALHAENAAPIIVGGTGLYVRTLLEGIAPIPPIDPAIREEVRALTVADAHAALSVEDPERAALLNAADTTRVARALEVIRSTGKPLIYWQSHKKGGIADKVKLHPLILLPEREALYERCDLRFSRMLDKGAIEEVEVLLQRNLHPDLPVMRAIGVREIAGLILGEWDKTVAEAMGAQATRNYAKRQYTWLKHQFPPFWPKSTLFNCAPEDHFATLLPI